MMSSSESVSTSKIAVEDPKETWSIEIRAAIEFEEDPHKAALDDNPELVYVGQRTWAAIFVSQESFISHTPLSVRFFESSFHD